MKKIAVWMLVLVCLLSLAGCGKTQVEEAAPGALPPQIMVDGILYVETGKESETTDRKDGFDGEITSSVPAGGRPTENDQSNFGTGYGYQFGEAEGTVEICINDRWWIYATSEVHHQISYPEQYTVVDRAPDLTVSYGEASIEPRIGLMCWEYIKADETEGALLGDGAHPLEAKHSSPFLTLDPESPEPFEIWLHWELMPDEVSVSCWNEDCWGQLTAASSECFQLSEVNEAGDSYLLRPQNGNYIYEINAIWQNAPNYSGKVRYNFHTVLRGTNDQPEKAASVCFSDYADKELQVSYCDWVQGEDIRIRMSEEQIEKLLELLKPYEAMLTSDVLKVDFLKYYCIKFEDAMTLTIDPERGKYGSEGASYMFAMENNSGAFLKGAFVDAELLDFLEELLEEET